MFETQQDYYAFEEVDPTLAALFDREWQTGRRGSVLDVGCGRGLLGEALEAIGFQVSGIEAHPVALEAARPRVAQLLALDLTDFAAVEADLGGQRFDYLLFADVLEHVGDPLGTLKFYQGFLKDGGRLIISVPNVAVWDNRLRLFFGKFDYADSGVMDRTHLRFFTFKSAGVLVREAGFEVTRLTLTPGVVRAFLPLIKGLFGKPATGQSNSDAIMNSGAYKFYLKVLLPVERALAGLMKGLFGFRIIIVAEWRTPKPPV